MTYKKNRSFRLWEYSVSHNRLLIRSEKQYKDVFYYHKYSPNVTIDIEFWGVEYIDLPTNLESLEISKIEKNLPVKFSDILDKEFNFYKINNEYFVIAAGCIVGESDWGSDKSRLQNPLLIYKNTVLSI